MKRLVIIESPYTGDVERNKRYLLDCMRDSMARGEAPFASHALYAEALDDDVPEERRLGIDCGLAWGHQADLVAVYQDYGISPGMKQGMDYYAQRGKTIVFRRLKETKTDD